MAHVARSGVANWSKDEGMLFVDRLVFFFFQTVVEVPGLDCAAPVLVVQVIYQTRHGAGRCLGDLVKK